MNIFTRYGLKEVANVHFEALSADSDHGISVGDIVLYLDSLQVSTIEQTAEVTDLKGGWGAPTLIQWNYGKDITITLDDALMTMESLRIMLGGKLLQSSASQTVNVRKTLEITVATATTSVTKPTAITGSTYKWINLTTGARGQNTAPSTATSNEKIRYFYDEAIVTTGAAMEIVISANTFPGTYKVYGQTWIRNQANGADEPFLFEIAKAKVNSETTLTMEAEGDPTTFSMSLQVLRDDEGNMMKLKKY